MSAVILNPEAVERPTPLATAGALAVSEHLVLLAISLVEQASSGSTAAGGADLSELTREAALLRYCDLGMDLGDRDLLVFFVNVFNALALHAHIELGALRRRPSPQRRWLTATGLLAFRRGEIRHTPSGYRRCALY